MKNTILTKTIATLLGVFALAFNAAAQTPPVGKYLCYQGSDSSMIGSLWIMPKSEYKITRDGAVGKFVYNAKTRELEWQSGSYVEYGWRGWYAAPGAPDSVRGETDRKSESILLKDKAKAGNPFAEGDSGYGYVRCYYADEQD